MKDNSMDGFFVDMDGISRDNPNKEWPKVADTYAFVKSVADDAQTIEDLRPNERAFSEPRFGLASKALKRFQNHLAMLRSGNFVKTMQLEDECKNLPSDIVEKLSHPLTDAEIHDMLLKAMWNCVASKNHEEYDFPCNRDAYKTQSLYQFVYDNGDFAGKPKTVRSWFLYWLGHEPKKAVAAHDAEVCRKVPDWFMDEQWSNGYASHCMYRNHVASIVEWYGLRKGRLVYTNSTDLACLSDFLKEVKGWTVNYNQGYLPRPTQKKTSKWMEFIHWMNEHSSLRLKTKEWAEKNVGQNSNRG